MKKMLSKLNTMILSLTGAVSVFFFFHLCFFNPMISHADYGEKLVLVQDGVSRVPIVIFEDAPPLTRQAGEELAYYIEKTSGARPEMLEGRPDPVPEHAVWVGYQPVLEELFPDLDFNFEHPEEILISANENHLVIAGRDRWDPDYVDDDNYEQIEYGTHNAVYTFLQDYLGVRWLWPGELGEDLHEQETIALDYFEYRYHPQVRARAGLLPYSTLRRGGPGGPEHSPVSRGGMSGNYWARSQRLQLGDLPFPGGGGGWGRWWHRYHETNPEYFALQPDGTRGGGDTPYPSVSNIKMCFSNPEVAEKWVDDVAAQLEENPNLQVFNAAPGDGWTSGHCICENCRAWDHPDGEMRTFVWRGISQAYVALSDRDVRFANRCARLLRERFPDKELYVYTYAYGHSRPGPIEAVPDDNVLIGNVANFLLRSDLVDRGSTTGKTHRENFSEWGRVTKNHMWRPNVGDPVGWQWGMPDVAFARTIEDMQFAAEHGWMGIYVDYVREHWSTQGPMYYLMAHLTWNPHQDGQAILKDYYSRAFGPAAAEMQDYWNSMEKIREECYGTENPGRSDHDILDFYNTERLDAAQEKLDRALARAVEGAEVYRRRIAFVQAGLDFTRLVTECGRLVREIKEVGDPDGKARAQVEANWKKLRALQQEHPGAVRWRMFFEGTRADGPPDPHRRAPALVAP